MAFSATKKVADEALQGRSIDGFSIEALPFGICTVDSTYRVVGFNRLFLKSLGVFSEESQREDLQLHAAFPDLVEDMASRGVLPAEAAQLLLGLLLRCQATQQDQKKYLACEDHAGAMVHCTVLPHEGYVFVVIGLSESPSSGKRIEDQVDRLSEALLNLPHGVSMYGPDERLIICNSRYISSYALDSQLVKPGTSYRDVLAHSIGCGNQSGMSVEEYYAKRIQENRNQDVVVAHSTLWNGRTMRITNRPLQHGGWVSLHEDVTDQLEASRQIAHLAHHDALTDLPNRHSFHAKFAEALSQSGAQGQSSAILYMDLDRFKQANDTFGHSIGDKLLVNVANRLRKAVRRDDLVVRLGGDEFVILQNGASRKISEILARRLIAVVSEPFDIDGLRIEIGLSVGIAMAPDDGDSAEVLLTRADQALYRAKSHGRGGYFFFGEGVSQDSN